MKLQKMTRIFIILFLCACLTTLGEGSKYVSKYNKLDANPFRMRKMNLIWEKANRSKRLDEKQLSELYSELGVMDEKEKDLKQMKIEGEDKDGLWEARVRKQLNELLRKYQLLDYFPQEKNRPDKKLTDDDYALTDDRLKSLLDKAKKEGFSDEELATLQEELGHQQLKLDEYSALKDQYHEQYDSVGNSLDHLDSDEGVWSVLEEKNKKLKHKHKQIQDDFKKLQHKARNVKIEFEDPRVLQLWTQAQKSGMSDEELDSIKKELSHFENRVKKTKFMHEQIKKTKEKIQTMDNFNHDQMERKQQELLERATHYESLMEKHHRDIKERIQKRLDEL